jgi:hypothetical protein
MIALTRFSFPSSEKHFETRVKKNFRNLCDSNWNVFKNFAVIYMINGTCFVSWILIFPVDFSDRKLIGPWRSHFLNLLLLS